MNAQTWRGCALALALAAPLAAPAFAATQKGASTPLLPGANSKEPISIDADKLDYFDKEQKAIYTGNVVVIQGETKMTCTMMVIFLAKSADAAAKTADGAAAAPAGGQGPSTGTSGTQVKHMDASGPVTVVSKTQVATGDRASYDKDQNKVWLFGNVTLSDGGNVTKGDKLTYDLTSAEAVVEGGMAKSGDKDKDKSTTRVHGVFIPGSGGGDGLDKQPAPAKKDAAPAVPEKPKTTQKKKAPTSDAAPKS